MRSGEAATPIANRSMCPLQPGLPLVAFFIGVASRRQVLARSFIQAILFKISVASRRQLLARSFAMVRHIESLGQILGAESRSSWGKGTGNDPLRGERRQAAVASSN
jgi:hypothetical protein